jgi:integrase
MEPLAKAVRAGLRGTSQRSAQGCRAHPRTIPKLLSLEPLHVTVPIATTIRRKRGPSLSRRRGQNGNVFQPGNPLQWNPALPAYGRYWIDRPGFGRGRKTIPLSKCATRTIALRKLREHIEKEGINTTQSFVSFTAPATIVRIQAEVWIREAANRCPKPVKPATIWGWRHSLDRWVLPILGDLPITDVGNAALKMLVEKMYKAELSPQTIVTHSRVVKMIVASAVNEDGEQIYPRKWNNKFIGIPSLNPEEQYRPSVTQAEVELITARSQGRYSMLFALLAGTGLRIGEALGLRPSDISADGRVLSVERSIWHGQEQLPKTGNALRQVDVPEPLAGALREFAQGKIGYLFASKSGKPLQQRNMLRVLHSKGLKVGFHAFRRFRTETLRRQCAPELLVRYWLGHSDEGITDRYAKGLTKDRAWRLECCDKVGLGFQLGHIGLQTAGKEEPVETA